MTQPIWKIISEYDLHASPHLPEVRGLALAEVDELGTLQSINNLGACRWNWRQGEPLPLPMRSALRALSALDALDNGVAQTLPVEQGGMALVGVSMRPEPGWLIIGHPSRKQLVARASTFKSLIEKVPVLMLQMRPDGTVTFADNEARRVTGYRPEQIAGRPFWLEVVHPEDRWKLTEALRRTAEGRKTAVSVRFLTPRQEIRLADLHLLPPRSLRDPRATIKVLVFDVTKQRQVEAALLQSEALYRTFLEQSPMGVLHLDKKGLVTFENHLFRQIIGEGVDDAWIGRRIDTVPGFDARLRPLLERMLDEGVPIRGEPATYRRRPGAAPMHLIVHGSPIRQPGDLIVGAVLMVEDVTEQHRRGEELALRDRYEKAQAELREAILADGDGAGFLQRAAAILGEATRADRVQLLTRPDPDSPCAARGVWARPPVHTPAPLRLDPDAFDALRTGVAQRRSLYLHLDRVTPGDKALLDLTRAAEAIWAPFYGSDRFAGLVLLERTALLPDAGTRFWPRNELVLITQLVRLFETLWTWMQVGQRYRFTVDNIEDCLFSFYYTPAGQRRYLFLTPQSEHLTGQQADELRTALDVEGWAGTLAAEPDHPLIRAHDEALRAGQESRVTFRIAHPDGETRWLCEHAVPVTDASGQITVSGILMDMTEQKAAEEVLRKAKDDAEEMSRLKSAFVATMSHEIRTPLGAIHGFAELLQSELQEWQGQIGTEAPPEIQEFAEAVRENAHRLLLLADDLFVLSNLEIGALRLQLTAVPVNPLVQQQAGRIAFPLSEKGVDLRVGLDNAGPVVLADAHRLGQVIDNLLRNAAKFTDQGRVQVRTARRNGEVMIEVSDTGVGIAQEHLAQLFTPFSQEDNRLNRKYEGTGLGLALVKRLLDLMNGRIEVESEKGRGSTFRVYLPSAPNDLQHAPPGQQTSRYPAMS